MCEQAFPLQVEPPSFWVASSPTVSKRMLKAFRFWIAPRDDWGLLHQSRTTLYETDFAPRHGWRALYYLESGRELITQPAYVGALQRDLSRLGYYCGPIDGVFSDAVSDAIAGLQKNYSMRVTGTLTIPVRRVLHLP